MSLLEKRIQDHIDSCEYFKALDLLRGDLVKRAEIITGASYTIETKRKGNKVVRTLKPVSAKTDRFYSFLVSHGYSWEWELNRDELKQRIKARNPSFVPSLIRYWLKSNVKGTPIGKKIPYESVILRDLYRIIPLKIINKEKPTYGAMGRKVTPLDTLESQYEQAMIPDRTINAEIDVTKYLHNEPIRKKYDLGE